MDDIRPYGVNQRVSVAGLLRLGSFWDCYYVDVTKEENDILFFSKESIGNRIYASRFT